MENGSSVLSSFFSLLCLAATCLVPLALVAGGVVFFLNRKKKNPSATIPFKPSPTYNPSNLAPPPPRDPAFATTPIPATIPAPIAPPVNPAPGPAIAPAVSPTATFQISPSELVLLRGEIFSPAAGIINSYKLVGTEMKVEAPTLARMMFTAAFLALAESGNVQLVPGRRKATLGLREVDTLYVAPTGQVTAWPQGSYENGLLVKAQETLLKQNNYVQNLVNQVMGQDSGTPWNFALDKARHVLGQRGVLVMTQEKGLLGTSYRYSMTPDVQAKLAGADVAALQGLIGRWQQSQPAIWKLLQDEISEGVKSRTEADFDSDGPDFD